MNSNYYEIYVDDVKVARYVTLEYACIFLKAIFMDFYNEPELKVSIKKMVEQWSN